MRRWRKRRGSDATGGEEQKPSTSSSIIGTFRLAGPLANPGRTGKVASGVALARRCVGGGGIVVRTGCRELKVMADSNFVRVARFPAIFGLSATLTSWSLSAIPGEDRSPSAGKYMPPLMPCWRAERRSGSGSVDLARDGGEGGTGSRGMTRGWEGDKVIRKGDLLSERGGPTGDGNLSIRDGESEPLEE